MSQEMRGLLFCLTTRQPRVGDLRLQILLSFCGYL